MSEALPSHIMMVGDYKVGSEIGQGSFATVYKAVHQPSNSTVAIKAVQRSKLGKKLLSSLESEIQILKTVTHPHIVGLVDYQKTSSYFFLCMEYCALGDLSFWFRKRKEISKSIPFVADLFSRYPSNAETNALHEDLARHFVQQLASAMEFLRANQLVHRDIKPQNLLLCVPSKSEAEAAALGYKGCWELPVLKLADFGFARFLPSSSLAETLCGSPLYMAPEILRYEKYNAKADLWSVGAVFYEMVTGKPPFSARNHVDLLANIEKANDHIKFPASVSDDVRRLIQGLLKNKPVDRMGFTEFFDDTVLKDSIQTVNKALDGSKLYGDMYISEYIQLGKSQTTTTYHQPKQERGALPVINSVELGSAPLSPLSQSTNKQLKHSSLDPSPSPGASWMVQTNKQQQQQQPQLHQQQQHQLPQQPLSPQQQPYNYLRRGSDKSPLENFGNDSDYVVIEKRMVEINAIADELSYSPKERHPSFGSSGSSRRRSSTSSRPSSLESNNRRNSISYGSSPSNALVRALTMASHRLLGTRVNEYGETCQSSPPMFSQRYMPQSVDYDERKIIKRLESLATKAKVISIFAEVKYSQTLPDQTNSHEDIYSISPDALVELAQQAVVLYVKTLSLLSKAMDQAKNWWKPETETPASAKLIDTVQWVREKFNECLEKAERVQNIAKDIPSTVTAEKLIFDRAMELSKDAARNELNNEDLDGCQLSYGTAIWMLEALLEPDKETLDEEDTDTVRNILESLSRRLGAVRAKMEATGQLLN